MGIMYKFAKKEWELLSGATSITTWKRYVDEAKWPEFKDRSRKKKKKQGTDDVLSKPIKSVQGKR